MRAKIVGLMAVSLVACLAIGSLWAQAPAGDQLNEQVRVVRAPEALGARELTAAEAGVNLKLTEDFVNQLRTTKEKFTEAEFNKFQEQFGLLPNGQLTYQVSPGVYFVLMTKEQVDAQPPLERMPAAKETADQYLRELGPEAARDTEEIIGKLPKKVDHTARQSPVENQGSRGTCTAFATCGGMEAKLVPMPHPIHRIILSENLCYYWFMKEVGSTPCDDVGIRTVDAPKYLKHHLVCEDKFWPYVGTSPSVLKQQGKCNLIDTPPSAVTGQRGWGIDQSVELPQGTEPNPNGSWDIRDTVTLERVLYKGDDIVFGTGVAWSSSDMPGIIDVHLGPSGQPIAPAGGHAMVIVGYDRTGPKPYFIVKNSWGNTIGHSGYLYFSYDYIRTYAKYGFIVNKLSEGRVSGID